MNKKEFSKARVRLGKTQVQLAKLLASSARTIQSYEQGQRVIPANVERQILFLLSMKESRKDQKPCWTIKKCSAERRMSCPAWEFRAGKFCWFINGTMCAGKPKQGWHAKMKICRSCEVMTSFLELE
jgi:DNA-binding XRE family transcriptional regulator